MVVITFILSLIHSTLQPLDSVFSKVVYVLYFLLFSIHLLQLFWVFVNPFSANMLFCVVCFSWFCKEEAETLQKCLWTSTQPFQVALLSTFLLFLFLLFHFTTTYCSTWDKIDLFQGFSMYSYATIIFQLLTYATA